VCKKDTSGENQSVEELKAGSIKQSSSYTKGKEAHNEIRQRKNANVESKGDKKTKLKKARRGSLDRGGKGKRATAEWL